MLLCTVLYQVDSSFGWVSCGRGDWETGDLARHPTLADIMIHYDAGGQGGLDLSVSTRSGVLRF